METWPAELQQHLNVDNFGVDFGETLVRSQMDIGPDKVRSRFTDGVDIYTTSIDLDIEDYDLLTQFYKTTLNNGANTFAFIDPLTTGSAEFRFLGPPSVRPLGGRIFRVTMKWEKLFSE